MNSMRSTVLHPSKISKYVISNWETLLVMKLGGACIVCQLSYFGSSIVYISGGSKYIYITVWQGGGGNGAWKLPCVNGSTKVWHTSMVSIKPHSSRYSSQLQIEYISLHLCMLLAPNVQFSILWQHTYPGIQYRAQKHCSTSNYYCFLHV